MTGEAAATAAIPLGDTVEAVEASIRFHLPHAIESGAVVIESVVVCFGPDCQLLLHTGRLDFAAQEDAREWYSAAAVNIDVPPGPTKTTVLMAVRRIWPRAQLLHMGEHTLREANTCWRCGLASRLHDIHSPCRATNPVARLYAELEFLHGFRSGYMDEQAPHDVSSKKYCSVT